MCNYCTTFTKLAVVFYWPISHELVTCLEKSELLRHGGGKTHTTILIITLNLVKALKRKLYLIIWTLITGRI